MDQINTHHIPVGGGGVGMNESTLAWEDRREDILEVQDTGEPYYCTKMGSL